MRFLLNLTVLVALQLLAPAPAQVELNIATGTVGLDYELLQSAVTRFMQYNPDVSVRLLYTPEFTDDRLSLLSNFFEVQSPQLDVVQLDTVWTDELAEHLRDLSGLVAGDSGIDSRLLELATADGRLVGVPWFTGFGVLYYRSDLLAAYGYEAPPATWQELEEMAAAIQAGERARGNSEFWGYVWQGHTYEGLTVNLLEWMVSSGAGSIVEPQGLISIANPRAEAVILRARDWIGTISPAAVLTHSEQETLRVFSHGNAAFMRNWPSLNALLRDSPRLAGRYGVAFLPVDQLGPSLPSGVLGGQVLAVSRYSNHPEASYRLVAFLASEQTQRVMAQDGSRIPTMPELYSDPEVLRSMPILEQLAPGLEQAAYRPALLATGKWSEVSRAVYRAVYELLRSDAEPGPALWDLSVELQALTGLPAGQPQAAP